MQIWPLDMSGGCLACLVIVHLGLLALWAKITHMYSGGGGGVNFSHFPKVLKTTVGLTKFCVHGLHPKEVNEKFWQTNMATRQPFWLGVYGSRKLTLCEQHVTIVVLKLFMSARKNMADGSHLEKITKIAVSAMSVIDLFCEIYKISTWQVFIV